MLRHPVPEIKKNLLIILPISLWLGLVWTQTVSPPFPGLDPSWQIGLAKAHEQGLRWGKDIIFTYGPFSYLLTGSLVEKNFLAMQIARYILSFSWIFFALNFIFSLKGVFIRLLGALCLVFVPSIVRGTSIDLSFLLLIQLVVLDLACLNRLEVKDHPSNLKIYLYGVLGIISLLIKFSFGFSSILCFSLVVLGASFNRLYSHKDEIPSIIQPLTWLLSGYFFGLLTFFSPLVRFPGIAIILACLPGILAALFLKQSKFQLPINPLKGNRALVLPGLALLSIGLLLLLNSSLREFMVGSLQLSSGYSNAMSLIGNPTELKIGLTLFFVLVALGLIAIIANPIANTGTALALMFLALVTLKQGFIRHDGHALLFALAAPSCLFTLGLLSLYQTSIVQPKLVLKCAKGAWLAAITASIVFLLGLGVDNSSISKYYELNIGQQVSEVLDLKFALQKLTYFLQPETRQTQLLEQSKETLAPSLIKSKRVLSKLKDKTVEILPWEVSVIEANQLKWHPSPVFQPYAAYTPWLDRKNLNLYKQNPPERIIYNSVTIDGRHPYFEQPLTNLFRLCHYRPLALGQQSIKSVGEIAVLTKRQTPLCSLDQITPVGEPITVDWEEKVDLEKIRSTYAKEPGNLLLVRVNIHHSIFGKLYNFLLRTPPVNINAVYNNSQLASYRLLIDNAKDSIIIGNLPTSFTNILNDFLGHDTLNPVTSIAFTSPNKVAFSKKIKLQFFKLKKQAILPKDFNPEQYLKLNLDVQKAGIDPRVHFLQFGFFEGRTYKK